MDMVKRRTPRSHFARDTLRAFWVGGAICAATEAYIQLLVNAAGMARQQASAVGSITLIALTAILTAAGIFDRIGRYAGGGTIVPITGFANSIVSSAMEYRSEGMVLGVGARMFQIAGPVLVYGISSSVIVGVVYWLMAAIWGI
ncbi:MAG: SpoVA/SpoVAEb family sporulation membrane protein [Candidatus Fimadaptatus sp.]|jgi:stage V sporulation protein AC